MKLRFSLFAAVGVGNGVSGGQLIPFFRGPVVGHYCMVDPEQAACHVHPHPAESDHCKLHRVFLQSRVRRMSAVTERRRFYRLPCRRPAP